MRVLLLGAHGFIGGFIARALRDAGHAVVAAVRTPRGEDEIACDLSRDVEPAIWLPRLAGIDAVVNCAGILRETATQSFAAIHVDAPIALFRACAQAGVRKIVQISALGEPEDGEFIASKHSLDKALAELDIDWTVLRPGLVYSAAGAYGGTALLRALCVLPGALFMPQRGAQRMRPIAAEDVGRAVVATLSRTTTSRQIIELVGPQTLTFAEYLRAWRAWFGLPRALEVPTPRGFVEAVVTAGETFTRGPLCRVIWNLLDRERVGANDASERIAATLGFTSRQLDAALRERPCCEEDLREARWYLWAPALRGAFALLWIASGCVGFSATPVQIGAALPGWPVTWTTLLARVTGAVDIALGVALLIGWRRRTVLGLMLGMLLAYTLGIGLFAPQHWLDPFGGLLKNLVLIVALTLLLALEARR